MKETYDIIINDKDKINVLNDIDRMIIEERGIAFEVTEIVNSIGKEIENNINQTSSLPYNINGITFKKGQNTINKFNIDISVWWNYYSYSSEDLMKLYPPKKINSFNKTLKTVYLTIVAINGIINRQDMYESLQHEIQHLFEIEKRGKTYNDTDLYQFATKILAQPLTEYETILANIIYLSRKYEQNAYINGLYQFLIKAENLMDLDNLLMDSRIFKGLMVLKTYVKKLESIDKNHPLVKSALNRYNTFFHNPYKEILKLGTNAIDEITRKIGRTISKVKDDVKDNRFFNEEIVYKINELNYPDYNKINKKFF